MAPSVAGEPNRSSLDADSFADVIKTVLKNFLNMTSKPGRSSKRSGSLVVDIELIKKRDYYTVQMTHCGRWTEQGIENLFNELNSLMENQDPPPNTVIANVFERVDAEAGEISYDIERGQDFLERKNVEKSKTVHCPSFKNYFMIRLRQKFPSIGLSELEKILVGEFDRAKRSHPDVKITFYCGKDVFYSNHVESDEDFRHCQSLSLPLIAIIRQSMNNRFKERCLRTLDAPNVHDARSILTRTLFSVVHENYVIP